MNRPRLVAFFSLTAALGAGCSSPTDPTRLADPTSSTDPTSSMDPTSSTGPASPAGVTDAMGEVVPNAMNTTNATGSSPGATGPGSTAGSDIDPRPALTPGNPGTADVQIEIRSDSDVHPISPLIYGTSHPEAGAQTPYGLLRSGGNRMTAYNWETNASNAGSDYFFQNDDNLSSSNTPGAALGSTLSGAKALGGTAMLTIPIVDYVAGDKLGGGDVRNSGPDYLQTRFKQNRADKGAELSTTPDVNDAFVNEDEFVNWVKNVGAADGPPVLFSLDNEPDLWSFTHAPIHPDPVTYDEVCTRNATYATMVKRVWPEAKVTGFVSYGFAGFVSLQDAPDAAGKGNFIDYYLEQMKAAEASAGHRVVDYLDLHWYPEATGGGVRIIGTDTSPESVAARVQAPRSLWDTTYEETSWIVTDVLGEPLRLIPRVKEQIAAHYPGTGLALTEWNYGGGQDISGGVAVADVLGILGSQGVDIASYWALGNESFANAAFRAYRNFDGANGAFGDTSIHAASSDVPTATVYASTDSTNPDRVVTVLINKATSVKTAGITIAHPSSFASLAVYTLTSASANVVAGAAVPAAAQNAFLYTMPALSVSVLVANTAADDAAAPL